MTRRSYFCGGSLLAVIMSLGLSAPALAQAGADKATDVEEVVVTGSYIAGTPEDAALPVDVIGADDLKKQGTPTVVQLVKQLTASQSALGESNRYNGGAGTASINLRGFGAARTLSLMNGRRLADTTAAAFQGGGADLNFIPQAAIGRIEILKDGAAATYGSDAVAGVVNFITRKDLDGFDVEAEYAAIDGSKGDYQASVAYGKKFENGNLLLTAGYRHRSRLDIHDRDYTLGGFAETGGYNGAGGWTGAANPGFYVQNNAAGTFIFRDNGCAELGGTLTNTVTLNNPLSGTLGQTATTAVPVPVNPLSPLAAGSVCRFQFANFNDLVNHEEHYQLYAEVNYEFSEKLRFHAEAAWSKADVPDQRLSPANLSTQFPTPISLGGTSGSTAIPGALNFFVRDNVPANNPGLIDLYTVCAAPLTAAQCTAMRAAGGVDISQTTFRTIAFAGHPTNKDRADHQDIERLAWRVSAGFNGEITDWLRYDAAVTYMEAEGTVNTNDLLVTRIQLALNGFGSLSSDPNSCAPGERTAANAGNAAVGCYFFNPFTNSVAVSAVNGQNNPFYRGGANPRVINNPELVEWLYGNYTNVATNKLLVGDLVFSGDTGLELAGGPVQWAAGAQWRYNRDINTYGDLFNSAINPCVDSIDDDTPVCGAPAGPLIFFGSNQNSDYDRTVYALFGELKVPIFDTLDASLAVRHEDYRAGIGATPNPKDTLRWQATDWLALRGTFSTTFRAPTAAQTINGCATGVANIGGQYRAVQTCGNPMLKPEKADSYGGGIIFKMGGLTATLDYYKFKFRGELTAESASRLFASMFTPNNCGNAAFAPLQARFTFTNAGCGAANVLRIDTFAVNGPSTKTSGLDFRVNYDWDDFLLDGTQWAAGAEATYLIEYKRGAFTLLGANNIVFSDPEDRAGLYDLTSQFFSYPELRANGFLSMSRGPLSVRWQARFTEGTTPAFGTTLFREVPVSTGFGYDLQPLGKSNDYWQHDLIVRYNLPWGETVVTGSVQNVFDKDPPFAASQYNYDYTNGNPLGRVFKINVRTRF